MILSRATCLFLSILIAASIGTTSCKPLDSQVNGGKPIGGTEKSVKKWNEWVPLKEELIEYANIVARQQGYDPAHCLVVYDEGKVRWKFIAIREIWEPCIDENGRARWREVDGDEFEAAVARRWPVLKGRDYQLITYLPWPIRDGIPKPDPDSGKWILLDRNTGATLLVLP